MEVQLEDRLQGKGDVRERWAETQGTVTGLLEDVQCLRQRLDVLDQRRIEPKDTDKRFNELAAQIQALEHQGRLSQAAWDESQRRQAARQRRWEQNLEELHTRIAAGEMANRGSRSNLALPEHFEARVRKLEQRQDYSESALTTLQMQVQEGLQAVNLTGDEDESMSERGLMALERKTSGQIQDLSSAVAGLRVRVDGQLQRMGSLAERLEAERSASPKGLALLRGELAQQVQEQQQYVTEMAVLRSKMQDFAECYDDSLADIKEVVRKARAELATLQALPSQVQAMQAELACVLGQVPQVPYGSEMLQLSQLQAEQGQLIPLEGLVPDANTQPSTTCYEVQSNSSEELFHYPPGLEVNGTLGDVQAFYGEGPADSDSDDSMAGHLAPPETAPELHLLAGHLLAADALAARVVELERYAGQSNAEGPMSMPETLSPLQVKLYRLSNEVGELQARLLSLRLQRELQAEAMLAEEMSDSALDLHGQAQDLRHLEEQVVELEQAFLPDQEPELLEDHGGEDTGLAELAERLEPLERAFRLVAERLKSLSPHEFLPSLVNGHGGGLEQLLAKVDNLELSPELEEKLRQIDAREEQDVAKAATNHVQDVQTLARQVSTYEEDLANVKLQTNGITKEVESLRADVEDLQALMRKATSVDGSSVSPLTKARGKLDLLCAQMAELQSRMRDAGPQQQKYYQERCSATRGEDEPEVGPGPRTAGFGGSPLRAQM
ncbi:Hypothetical protein (Fragment) [Durusdinium trenchii]|uniref:Uncharacterized protein n=1 Tax=Durusdinium trenchii TaxID=1381693 RepID=A0ABP0S9Q2_9DINO